MGIQRPLHTFVVPTASQAEKWKYTSVQYDMLRFYQVFRGHSILRQTNGSKVKNTITPKILTPKPGEEISNPASFSEAGDSPGTLNSLHGKRKESLESPPKSSPRSKAKRFLVQVNLCAAWACLELEASEVILL